MHISIELIPTIIFQINYTYGLLDVLRHGFKHRGISFRVCYFKPESGLNQTAATIDVLIYGDNVYLFTLNGENLFNMERSYKALCSDYIVRVENSGIVVNFEHFSNIAGSGHNPRRFVSYNQAHLEKLKNASTRRRIAEKFSIPLCEGKFDASQAGAAERIVKLLCDKGMVDPFENMPMEVPSAKRWE